MRIEAVAGAEEERSSLEDLYIRHAPGARTTAYLLLGDRALAEDLVQEAFLRLIGRFRHLRSRQAFDSYLRRAVVNLCLNHLRHRRVERAYLQREGGRAGPPSASIPDVGTREELWRALLQLPARRRAAVVLRYYEDLPERQVAEILGCSVPAVRSLVARGMGTLRERIGRGDER